ncbi:dienelactone hydrolase family protein [Rhodoferax sp. WC2427]|uniref:dienelactone hydrolase family protein n=1 Tax=Rhodoferax sp. WC2427 TaxID=3234144 RepID=UPI0034673D0C
MTRTRCLPWALAALCLGTGGARAQTEPPLNTALREEVQMVKKAGLFTIELETTFFRPPGAGPFPVVIINHGKAPGNTKFQPRARYEIPAREFVQRGYLVAVPMRQGFSKSSGSYISGGCNVESNGRVQAEDVTAVLAHLKTVPDADTSRVLVVGQSHGGLTTLAFGTLATPGVKGLVNFAGGLRQDQCVGWESNLVRALQAYGGQTTVPSLWFYGDNDSYWRPALYKDMHQKYQDGGGKARLVAFGNFGSDAHSMFGARAGLPIWVPEVDAFLAELGLPHAVRSRLPVTSHATPPPSATGFAKISDEKALPRSKESGQQGFLAYGAAESPKAFAISATGGAWASSTGRANAMQAALDRCNSFAKDASCKLYAVDDAVVWDAAAPP